MLADALLSRVARVIPVAPVNPPVQASAPLEPRPGVVNHVHPALLVGVRAPPNEGEPTYTSVPDPLKRSAAAARAPHDWAASKPAPEKVEEPPKKPISQLLLDNLRSIWSASAGAVQLEQTGQLGQPVNRPTPIQPTQLPADLAKQMLTYQPSKIQKNEKV